VCALSPEGDDSGEPALLPDDAKLCSWAGVESALFVHAWTVAVKSATGSATGVRRCSVVRSNGPPRGLPLRWPLGDGWLRVPDCLRGGPITVSQLASRVGESARVCVRSGFGSGHLLAEAVGAGRRGVRAFRVKTKPDCAWIRPNGFAGGGRFLSNGVSLTRPRGKGPPGSLGRGLTGRAKASALSKCRLVSERVAVLVYSP
jgi:hypothetical protein